MYINHNNYDNARRYNDNPKFVAIAVVIAICFAVFCVFKAVTYMGDHEDSRYEGIETNVTWTMVNLREDHSTESEVVAELHAGNRVTLTSNVFEAMDAEWIYVHSEKGDGWVVTAALYNPYPAD